MRVYKRTQKWEAHYTYPDDMHWIMEYLTMNGELRVNGYTIEALYRDFSEEKYSAGWMDVNENTLDEFADWLDGVEL